MKSAMDVPCLRRRFDQQEEFKLMAIAVARRSPAFELQWLELRVYNRVNIFLQYTFWAERLTLV
jgi:hypothetical protein